MDELVERIRRCSYLDQNGDEVCRDCPNREDFYECKQKLALQAADAIEELSKPKWISVEEKLAEWPCIVYDANGNLPFIPHGILTITDAQGAWQIDAHLADPALHQGKIKPVLGYGNRITHWMPLPQPPKAEEGE